MGCCWGQGQRGPGSYASHKCGNVARDPSLLTLTCTLNPTPNPKPLLNAGSKPKAKHEPSTLAVANLHPKPSLSPCRLEALYLLTLNPKHQTHKPKLSPKTPQPSHRRKKGLFCVCSAHPPPPPFPPPPPRRRRKDVPFHRKGGKDVLFHGETFIVVPL